MKKINPDLINLKQRQFIGHALQAIITNLLMRRNQKITLNSQNLIYSFDK